MVNGKLETFTRYEDIPGEFDHVIEFVPHIPDGPHTHEEHDEIAQWVGKLNILMEKERARSN